MFKIFIPFEFFIVVLAGLFLGRLAYFLVCIFEGRNRIHPYKCPGCLQWIGIFPLLSWCIQWGKCQKCMRRLDIWCPLIECFVGAGFFGIFLFVPSSWFSLETALFCFMAIVACVIDIKRTILPDTLTLGGTVLALAGAFLNPERQFMEAFLGVLLGGGFLIAVSYGYYLLRKTEGMGGGDIKMLAWIGALVGWKGILPVLMGACLLGSLVGLMKLTLKRTSGHEIAFGPYLAFSSYIFILFSKDFIF